MNLEKMIYKKKFIINKINQGNFRDALEDACKYLEDYTYDYDIYSILAMIYMALGKFEDAELKLKEALELNPFNLDTNINLANYYFNSGNTNEAFKYYVRSHSLAKNEEKKELLELISKIYKASNERELLAELNNQESMIFNYSYRFFPIDYKGNISIGKSFMEKDKEYFIALNDRYYVERDGIELFKNTDIANFFKLEIKPIERIKQIKIDGNSVILPLCRDENSEKVNMYFDDKNYEINKLRNRFYYYNLQDKKVEIKSDKEFLVSDLIEKNGYSPDKKRVFLNIFVDGLSQKVLEEYGIENIMPRTSEFFKDSLYFKNTYVTGDWTFPNMATFFTGKYIKNHGMYHPNFNSKLPEKDLILAELFKERGYLTAKIDGDWRSVPTYGYIRGVDRFVYQSAIRGMSVKEVVNDTIEHIETYRDNNNFVWICISDLHDVADHFETDILGQKLNSLEDRFYNYSNMETSVRKGQDDLKKNRYVNKIKEVDFNLNVLYSYLNEFKDEEIVVTLFSDHGQGYLVPNGKPFLSDERTKVPFLIKSSDVKNSVEDELLSIVDFLPTWCKLGNVNCNDNYMDGKLPKVFGGKGNEYVLSESIFPNSTYKLAISSQEKTYYFETVENVGEDGRFSIEGYQFKCKCKNTNKYIKISEEEENDILKKIFNHIKENIIF